MATPIFVGTQDKICYGGKYYSADVDSITPTLILATPGSKPPTTDSNPYGSIFYDESIPKAWVKGYDSNGSLVWLD